MEDVKPYLTFADLCIKNGRNKTWVEGRGVKQHFSGRHRPFRGWCGHFREHRESIGEEGRYPACCLGDTGSPEPDRSRINGLLSHSARIRYTNKSNTNTWRLQHLAHKRRILTYTEMSRDGRAARRSAVPTCPAARCPNNHGYRLIDFLAKYLQYKLKDLLYLHILLHKP